METLVHTHIELFSRYARAPLTRDEIDKAVAEALNLQWLKQLLVFSNQAVFILELQTFKYLYISESVRNILGFEHHEIKDLNTVAGLMSQEELAIAIQGTELILSKISQLGLSPAQGLNIRATRNNWIRRKDGVVVNTLQHMIPLLVSDEGMPLLQMTLFMDITAFNNQPEHFYSIARMNPDGSQETIFSQITEDAAGIISDREKEILRLLSRGCSSDEIAVQLGISNETVKTHRKHLLEKTKSKNSIDLVRFGFANGWL